MVARVCGGGYRRLTLIEVYIRHYATIIQRLYMRDMYVIVAVVMPGPESFGGVAHPEHAASVFATLDPENSPECVIL